MTIRLERRHIAMLVAIAGLLVFDRFGGSLPNILPTPDTAPFPADGLHVLGVYQDSSEKRLTKDQRAILYGAEIREFLEAVACDDCFRMLDADSDMTHAEQVWKDAMSVPRASEPWVVISNGRTGFSGPLDMTAEEFKSLVGEHADGT